MKKHTFATVEDWVENDFGPELGKAVRDAVDETRLTTELSIARNRAGLSQRQLAKKMGVSASKICRMESGVDSDLDFGFVAAYCAALGQSIKIEIVDPHKSEADKVREAVESVRTGLDTLASVATADRKTDLQNRIKEVKADILLDFAMSYPLAVPNTKAG